MKGFKLNNEIAVRGYKPGEADYYHDEPIKELVANKVVDHLSHTESTLICYYENASKVLTMFHAIIQLQ